MRGLHVYNMQVENVPIDSLRQSPENANNGDLDAIDESFDVNGFFSPLLVQRSSGEIIAGNHRWLAAKAREADEIPVIYLDVDDNRKRHIMLADNQITRRGRDDQAALAQLLRQIENEDGDLRGTGFYATDLEKIEIELDSPLTFDVEDEVDDDVEGMGGPRRAAIELSATPIVDSDGEVYAIELAKEGMDSITRADYMTIMKSIGLGRPRDSDVDAFGVPAWGGER